MLGFQRTVCNVPLETSARFELRLGLPSGSLVLGIRTGVKASGSGLHRNLLRGFGIWFFRIRLPPPLNDLRSKRGALAAPGTANLAKLNRRRGARGRYRE